ncbi:MAG: flagellar hook-basal body complex protein [candidate division Zixibacteria bacterium]|nr:flagellar hook-basal body complex protein [candidate division Zixibacteria bacterium]
MMASLFAGVSGLKNHQVKLNVIGNNIANVNTIGFKSSRVNFQEALIQTFKGAGRPSDITGGTNPIQLGLGMKVASVDTLFAQGGLETTGQITDLAIQGSGFFVLGDGNDNRFYTRAGAFGFDANSALVDPATGLYVMGKMANATGIIPSLATTGPITLPFGQQDPASATSVVTLANNLDATASDSTARLISAGTSNVLNISGIASEGVGGRHTITVTGNQSTTGSFTGAHIGGPGALALSTDLTTMGVTVFNDFSLTVDGSSSQLVTGLSGTSTMEDLINAINQIAGITAELAAGEIMITRDKAGADSSYNFASSDSVANNITNLIFGVAVGAGNRLGSAAADGGTPGTAHTYVATDSFVPTRGTGPASGPKVTSLDLVINSTSGLVTGLSGLGGTGVEITTGVGGLAAAGVGNELIVDTSDTVHSMSIQIYDSQGGKHTLAVEFFKSLVQNRWEWTVSTLGDEIISAGGSGYIAFNPDGSLNSFDYNGGTSSVVINPNNGAENIDFALNAGTFSEFDGMTGFASGRHTASIVRQDGYGLGILEKIAIDGNANISGIFSNGVTRVLAQLVLADFSNKAGLRRAGRSMYPVSPNSGSALEGVAGATIAATVSSGALEASSVDIAQEFTSMITAQRGFQANARIITTSDSMLDELVNIKR